MKLLIKKYVMKLLSALFILDNMLLLVFSFNPFMHNTEK